MNKDIFLTFDMDWASDEVLKDFYELIVEYDVRGTIHVTHENKYVDIFSKSGRLELGIHPNFSFLLEGKNDDRGRNYNEIIKFYKRIVPSAVCMRSHALVSSSIFETKYDENGIKFDLNRYIPPHNGMSISGWKSPLGNHMVLPFIYEDDVYLLDSEKKDMKYYLSDSFEAPRIFNFHPVHLFLNTYSFEHYESVKNKMKEDNFDKYVNHEQKGIRDYFGELITIAKNNDWNFKTISEGEWK